MWRKIDGNPPDSRLQTRETAFGPHFFSFRQIGMLRILINTVKIISFYAQYQVKSGLCEGKFFRFAEESQDLLEKRRAGLAAMPDPP